MGLRKWESDTTVHCKISSHMTKQPDGIFIVAGDFNQIDPRPVIPKFHQHVQTKTCLAVTKPSPIHILVNQIKQRTQRHTSMELRGSQQRRLKCAAAWTFTLTSRSFCLGKVWLYSANVETADRARLMLEWVWLL